MNCKKILFTIGILLLAISFLIVIVIAVHIVITRIDKPDKPISDSAPREIQLVVPEGAVATEEQFKEDVLSIGQKHGILTGKNVYDLYENNGITTFTFPEEAGYKNGGVVLDFSTDSDYGIEKEKLTEGCMEVEFILGLWRYITERQLPFHVDGIHINHAPVGTWGIDTSSGSTMVHITRSEYHELLNDETLSGMNEDEMIRHMAKAWCEKTGYKRVGTKLQPFTTN